MCECYFGVCVCVCVCGLLQGLHLCVSVCLCVCVGGGEAGQTGSSDVSGIRCGLTVSSPHG